MLVAPVLALTAACAGQDYGAYLDRYVGVPESALAARWGPPDWRNQAADGSADLHYIYEEPVCELIGSADGDRYVWKCLTTFRVEPGLGANQDGGSRPAGPSVVWSWRYSGNHCVAPAGDGHSVH